MNTNKRNSMKIPIIASAVANLALVGALFHSAVTEKDLRKRLDTQRENVKLTFLVAEKWKSVAMDCRDAVEDFRVHMAKAAP